MRVSLLVAAFPELDRIGTVASRISATLAGG